MKIFFKCIDFYCLTLDSNSDKYKHVKEIFKEYKITDVNPIKNIPLEMSGSIGWCRLINKGLQKKEFEPFVLLEDDVSICKTFPEFIEIPDDADWIYIGISEMGVKNRKMGIKQLCGDHYDDNFIRVYNMLQTHGIIVTSIRGALGIHTACLEGYFNCRIWDYYVSQSQPYFNVYALKEPLVFQDENFGGTPGTNIKITNEHIFEEYSHKLKNDQMVSFKTICPK